MDLEFLKIKGDDAVRILNEHRARYPTTGLYPFLIGDATELRRIEETAGFNDQDPGAIVAASFDVSIADWIAQRRMEAEEDEFAPEELLGDWPGDVAVKGSIILHKDILSDEIKSEVYLGLAKIESPWRLPAAIRYGGWNACPEPEVHCAFHRSWLERYGAEITGTSGDVVECVVANPPTDREAALALAWEQFWYCADVVEQGCGSISYLAGTLLNSPYWYFWWD